MTATTSARPRLWPLAVAVGACLLIGLMLVVGGTKARSVTPQGFAGARPLALDTTVTEVSIDVVPTVITTTVYTPSYLPPSTTFGEITSTKTHTITIAKNVTRTQTNHVNTTAVFNVNQTNQVNATVLATKQITKGVNVTNSVIVTNTAQETQTALSTQTVEVQAAAKSKPLADQARLAIGAGGVAVTSAAGFGFLMLRRRGRYS